MVISVLRYQIFRYKCLIVQDVEVKSEIEGGLDLDIKCITSYALLTIKTDQEVSK